MVVVVAAVGVCVNVLLLVIVVVVVWGTNIFETSQQTLAAWAELGEMAMKRAKGAS